MALHDLLLVLQILHTSLHLQTNTNEKQKKMRSYQVSCSSEPQIIKRKLNFSNEKVVQQQNLNNSENLWHGIRPSVLILDQTPFPAFQKNFRHNFLTSILQTVPLAHEALSECYASTLELYYSWHFPLMSQRYGYSYYLGIRGKVYRST